MINKQWFAMNDINNITIDLDSIDAFYGEKLEHPRIYVYVKGAKIVMNYKNVKDYEGDLNKIKYGIYNY